VWLIWVFDQDTGFAKRAAATEGQQSHRSKIKGKVAPPRLSQATGKQTKVGVFSTRSPHRPNPIGLSTARVVSVDSKRGIVELAALDLIDGTPILDIKPYLPWVDAVPAAATPSWIPDPGEDAALGRGLQAEMDSDSEEQLAALCADGALEFYDKLDDVKAAILEVAAIDIRSAHKINQKQQQEHHFLLDNLKVTFRIDGDLATVCEVQHVKFKRSKQANR